MISKKQDEFRISNPPDKLSMVDVMGVARQFGGFAKSCRYFMRIRPQGQMLASYASQNRTVLEQLSYLAESAEMPGRGFMNINGRYFGPDFKVPFQSQYEDVTITFLCRNESRERRFFDDWMEIINPTNNWNFNYRDHYTAMIDIFQLAEAPDVNPKGNASKMAAPLTTYQWTLHDAYPTVVNPQQVTWADDNFQRLTIAFTYTNWTRPYDKQPRGADPNRFIDTKDVTGLSSYPLPSKL